MKENRYVPVSTSHQKRMAALHQIRLKKKEPENSPSMVQSTAEAVDDDSDEALAIRKPNGSLADHINYNSITRATKQAEAYF